MPIKIRNTIKNYFSNPDYTLIQDISFFLGDLFGDFELLFSRNNRIDRAKKWDNHLETYAKNRKIADIDKINFLADHLKVLDTKFNGYLTFLTLLGAIVAFEKIFTKDILYNSANAIKYIYIILTPYFCYYILFAISLIRVYISNIVRHKYSNFYCYHIIQLVMHWLWNFLVLAVIVIYIYVIICYYNICLVFFSWLIFSILLCFVGSQMLYWGGMKINADVQNHINGMIRAVIYRTMLYRFAWISILVTLILFFIGIISLGSKLKPEQSAARVMLETVPLQPYSSASATEPSGALKQEVCKARGQFQKNGTSIALIVGRNDIRELSATARLRFTSNADLAQQRADNIRNLLTDPNSCVNLPSAGNIESIASYPKNTVIQANTTKSEMNNVLSEDRRSIIYGFRVVPTTDKPRMAFPKTFFALVSSGHSE